jgi:hypothetical protein
LSGCALQHDARVGGGKHRQRVAGGRRVGDVPAERAAILNLHAADFPRRGSEHRQSPAHQRRSDDGGVGRQRANRQHVTADLDRAQGVEPPEIEKAGVGERPEIQRDVQVGAPRHRRQRTLVAQQRQRLAKRARAQEYTVRYT